jgi:hypothetical protein
MPWPGLVDPRMGFDFRAWRSKSRRPKVPPVTIIIRLAFAAALSSAAAIGFGVPESRASTYGHEPWCAVVDQGAGNVMWECEYQSIAECQPNVLAGNRGFCQRNPYYRAAAPQYYDRGAPPPGASRWRDIGHGNYVGD